MLDDPTDTFSRPLVESVRAALHPDRRLGRVLALQTLYETDLTRHEGETTLRRLVDTTEDNGWWEERLLKSAGAFAGTLFRGVLEHRSNIDALIQERTPQWPLAHLAAIDRSLLRLGLYETLHSNDKVPVKAAINEAVELARFFGSDTSARFVNGVLGRVVSEKLSTTARATPSGEDNVSDAGSETAGEQDLHPSIRA